MKSCLVVWRVDIFEKIDSRVVEWGAENRDAEFSGVVEKRLVPLPRGAPIGTSHRGFYQPKVFL